MAQDESGGTQAAVETGTDVGGAEGAATGDGYTVGYGRPPLHTRFRKGQSGNPSGRRRRPTDLASLLTRALDRPAAAEGRGGGTQREAIVAALVEKSAAGDLRATKLLFELMRQIGPAAAPALPASPLEDPREILLEKLARFAGSHGEKGPV